MPQAGVLPSADPSLGVQNGQVCDSVGTCRSEWGNFVADDGQECYTCCKSAEGRPLSSDDNERHTWRRCCRSSP